jgi:hypothetical protein
MLVIREQQMAGLRDALWRAFEQDLVTEMSNRFPAECETLGPAGIRTRVASSLEEARRLGFRRKMDISRFVSLPFLLGAGYKTTTEFALIQDLVADQRYSPEVRIDLIMQIVEEHLHPARQEQDAGMADAESEDAGPQEQVPVIRWEDAPGADPSQPEPYNASENPPTLETDPPTPVPDNLTQDPHYVW